MNGLTAIGTTETRGWRAPNDRLVAMLKPFAPPLAISFHLAGVMLPCLVTCLTIAREQGRAFALRLVGRQAVVASWFSALPAWGGAWL